MTRIAHRWLGRSLLGMAAALSSACLQDAPVAPLAGGLAPEANADERRPDLTGCEQLAAPEGSTLVFSAYAVGVQIYRWNGTSWGSSVPAATLYPNAKGRGVVGTHFAGPTWQSNSGGRVVGTVADRCTADPASIPWLSLTAVPEGPGPFSKVTFIQRLNTTGGRAPSTPGSVIGEEARVPYTADYLFYKAP